jgi:hypothetical protein
MSGYIVTERTDGPRGLTSYGSGPEVLCDSSKGVAVFPTRKRAQRAIDRTVDYVCANHLPWLTQFEIVRLAPVVVGQLAAK